ncbi:MAG: hypothetical protein AB7J32_17640 [Pseudonocardia sp.]
MLAIVAAVLFGISLLFRLAAFAIGPVDPDVLDTAGFLCVALYLAGIGAGSFGRARARRR